ncbi:MAG: protein archease [Ignavibacteria bacterium]
MLAPASRSSVWFCMNEPFRILDHPADLGVEANGSTLAEAFQHAAKGLMTVILDLDSVACREAREVVLRASDREQLLVKWLSEILYLYDGGGFVGKEFTITQLSDTALQAQVHGERFDAAKHRTRLDVKAITYHQLAVTLHKQGATVRVYLDM